MSSRLPSLRRQLAWALAGCLTLLCLAANVAFYHYVRKLSIEEFDAALQADLKTVVAMTSVHDGGNRIDLHIHNHDHPEYREDHEDAKFYHISHADVRSHLRSRSLNSASLPVLSETHEQLVFQDIALPDGRRGRVASSLSMIGETNSSSMHSIHFAIAVSRESLDHILAMQRWCAIALGGLLIAASIAIALALTKRSFRKVDEFSKHMRSIDFDTLGNRLPEENLAVELAPLARRFNEALVRLDRGAQREIRFHANVAHELRTPVAELRAIADVGLQEAREGALENPASYFEDATELAKRMARLVDTISSLNRTGLGRELIERSKTDLVELVARAWRPHEERAVSRGLSVQFDVPDTHPVETDASLVTAIITNLLVNAVSHTPKGGDLKVTLVNNRLSITNTNHDLSETDLPHLFEPFWQKDASRSDSAHFGIGMALVDAYARLLGIKVRLNLDIHERFEVALIFP